MTTRKPRKSAAKKGAEPQLSAVADAVNDQKVREAQATKSKSWEQPESRKGKKGLVLYVDPMVTVALRRLALDTGKSVQDLGMDALNGLFRAHDLPEFSADKKDVC